MNTANKNLTNAQKAQTPGSTTITSTGSKVTTSTTGGQIIDNSPLTIGETTSTSANKKADTTGKTASATTTNNKVTSTTTNKTATTIVHPYNTTEIGSHYVLHNHV